MLFGAEIKVLPLIRQEPESAFWIPASMESRVDLPQPFAPRIPMHSPLDAARFISVRIFFLPLKKLFCKCLMVIDKILAKS